MALSPEAFEAEMSERSCHILGPLALATKRSIWPIIAQLAERISAKRVALIAEAAHVVPPIGAQGLNMSLSDIKPCAISRRSQRISAHQRCLKDTITPA